MAAFSFLSLLLVCSALGIAVFPKKELLPERIEKTLEKWDKFKAKYGKTYANDAEEAKHKKAFVKNSLRVEVHNLLAKRGMHTFELEINSFGDALREVLDDTAQFRHLSRLQSDAKYIGNYSPTNASSTALPDHVDWRRKQVVTPVKDQGRFCRSSYAFASIGAVESYHAILSGKLVRLSEQNIVDCAVGPKDCYRMVPPPNICSHGCKDGIHCSVFEYIMANRGVDTELGYPYVGEDQQCKFNATSVGATVKGYTYLGGLPADYEIEMKEAVANKGPVVVVFDGRFPFDFYKKGVYDACPSEPKRPHFSHFGLVVGYGSEAKSDYWIVKMSYGPNWGEDGYVRMARNKNNRCGISTFGIFPKLD